MSSPHSQSGSPRECDWSPSISAVTTWPTTAVRSTLDVRGWPTRAPSLAALAKAIEARGVPDTSYFLQSAVPEGDGWRLLFDPDEMMDIQRHGLGDWWPDWLGSRCPALLLRGARSMMLPTGLAADMVHRRPHTTLVELPTAGHWIHDDDPDGCADAILDFLLSLAR
ncbi:MAG: alpha/beta fold hydrolase [Mycobacteriales bacterium]